MWKEDLLGPQLVGVEQFLFLPRVADGDQGLKRFIIQRCRHDRRFIKGESDHDHVQLSVFQHARQIQCKIFFKLQRHLRRTCVQQWDQIRKDIWAHSCDDAKPQKSIQLIFSLSCKEFNSFRFFQDTLCLVDDLLSERYQLVLVLVL